MTHDSLLVTESNNINETVKIGLSEVLAVTSSHLVSRELKNSLKICEVDIGQIEGLILNGEIVLWRFDLKKCFFSLNIGFHSFQKWNPRAAGFLNFLTSLMTNIRLVKLCKCWKCQWLSDDLEENMLCCFSDLHTIHKVNIRLSFFCKYSKWQ